MSKYKWDIKEIRDNYNTLLQLLNETNDEDEIFLLSESLENMEDLLNQYCNRYKYEFSFDNSFKDMDDILDSVIEDSRKVFINNKWDNSFVVKKLLGAISIVLENYSSRQVNDIPINATNDELINIADNFFKLKTPPYVYKRFKSIIKEENHININYVKHKFDHDGFTIYDEYLNQRYIGVFRNNNLSDIITLPHEIFHYMFGLKHYYYIDNNAYLPEIEGCLANFLFADYYKENAGIENYFFIEIIKKDIKGFINDLSTRIAILDSTDDNNKIRFNKVFKLLNYYNFNLKSLDDMKKYLGLKSDTILIYGFSYLVALDLYNIYLKDPDKAIYYLNNITSSTGYIDTMTLLKDNEITFIHDGYKNLVNYMKK